MELSRDFGTFVHLYYQANTNIQKFYKNVFPHDPGTQFSTMYYVIHVHTDRSTQYMYMRMLYMNGIYE